MQKRNNQMNALSLEFPETNYADWEKQFLKEIADVPLDSLMYGNDPKIKIHPFQFNRLQKKESEKKIVINENILGANYWYTTQLYYPNKNTEINTILLHDLNLGLEAIHLQYQENFDLKVALNNINLNYVPLTIHIDKIDFKVDQLLLNLEKIRTQECSISIALKADKLVFSNECDLAKILSIAQMIQKQGFNFCFDFSWSGDNGFSHQTQFAIWLHILSNSLTGLNPNQIQFQIAVQPAIIEEVVKINTLKQLYYNLLSAENKLLENSAFKFKAVSGKLFLSKYDQNNNLIRLTSIAMASAYSGCNEMLLDNFDKIDEHPQGFGSRIARNIQHLLKEESYFHQVKDALKGAYAIENLTHKNLELAWDNWINREEDYFKGIERLRLEMKLDQENWIKAIKNNKTQLIGINKYSTQKLIFNELETNDLKIELNIDELFNTQQNKL
jgi:methylmalonyl-CoA mutase